MGHIKHFDHVGLTVSDLDASIAFFEALGLRLEGRMQMAGEFVDTVTGIPDVRCEIAMLRPPGGGAAVELSCFEHPHAVAGSPHAMSNELGLRNVAFEVDDIEGAIAVAAGQGYGLVGGLGEYEGVWQMAYVRGPDGIIVALAQRIG